MRLHIVQCDQVEPRPWRNGGGHTRELLAWPKSPDWQLRISVADIERDGQFSPYPGIERWIAAIEGAGVRLALNDQLHTLGQDSAPLHFRGELAPGCELLDGPTRDLNLMHVRGRGPATMQRAEPGLGFSTGLTMRALFCADAVELQAGRRKPVSLAPFSLAWADDGVAGPWRVHGRTPQLRAWWMGFDALGAA